MHWQYEYKKQQHVIRIT